MFIAIMLKSSLFWIYADVNGAILAICLFYNLQFTFPLIIYSVMYFKLIYSMMYFKLFRDIINLSVQENFDLLRKLVVILLLPPISWCFNFIEYELENIILLLFLLRFYFLINRWSVSKWSVNTGNSISFYIKRHIFIRDARLPTF